jgi:ferric-dicitrate binding protein FerR (iron transport regulator)
MADQNSHNTPEKKLADHIEQVNAGFTSLDPSITLVPELTKYKTEKLSGRVDTFAHDRQEVWAHIAAATKPRATIHTLFQSKPVQMAVAAAILVVAVLSIFYVQQMRQPTLVGEAGPTIATLHLQDGSTIKLRPHSKLYEIKHSAGQAAYKLEGEGFFDITHNESRTFSVQSASGKVSVLGTRFNLSSWGNRLQVFLEEGSVQVKAAEQDSALILKPGEAAVVTSATSIPQRQPFSLEEGTDWLSNQMVFQQKKTRIVIAEVEQQFNISISIPESVADEELTGRLSLQDVDTALSDLGMALNGSFTLVNPSTYTFNPN